MSWPWSVLGLPGPSELPEIRRAYAQKLKTTHPEEDPEGFQRLHDAYQQACRLARQKKRGPIPSLTGDARPKPSGASRTQTPSGEKEAPKDGGEDWDYEELLKTARDAKTAKKPPEEDEDGGEDWDYEELLKTARDAKTVKKPPEEDKDGGEDWDYEELLKTARDAKTAKKPPEKDEDGGEDWDYEELLKTTRDAKTAEKPPEDGSSGGTRAKDWDFERLFAEGEEEVRSAERRKIEELREKNRARIAAQEKEQRRRAGQDEETWAAVMAATHALTLLQSTGASTAQWQAFLHSQVFWNVKSNLDFIFALEDFLEQNPDLPRAVRKAIYTAYGFERTIPMECRVLARLLGLDRKERRRLRWANSEFRKQWRRWPVRRRFATLFSTIFLAIMVLVALWGLLEDGIFVKPWQETMCGQLETDYGRKFVHPYKDGEYIFAPEEDPELLFFAFREENGGGYRTNYPERMVMDAMQDFAEEWGLPLDYDSAGEKGYQGQLGETPGAYLLQMPLEGKGEAIPALGELLASLKRCSWYQTRTPDFEVFLSYGDLHFYKFRSTEEDFDADYARTVYETKFGPEICRYIAEASELNGSNVVMEKGTLSGDGTIFFWCAEMSRPPDSVPLRHYLLSADGSELYIVSNATIEAGLTPDSFQGLRANITRNIPELGDHASVKIVYTAQ